MKRVLVAELSMIGVPGWLEDAPEGSPHPRGMPLYSLLNVVSTRVDCGGSRKYSSQLGVTIGWAVVVAVRDSG